MAEWKACMMMVWDWDADDINENEDDGKQ